MKGNFAYLKYDKLIVKENNITKDKRKREISSSPRDNTHAKKQQLWTLSQGNRHNAFDLMRVRSNSLSSYLVKNRQQQLDIGNQKTIQHTKIENQIIENHQPPPSRLVLVGEKDRNPLKLKGNKMKYNDLHITTLNCRSLGTAEKCQELELA